VLLTAAVLIQVVPLPAAMANLISPHAPEVRAALALAPGPPAGWHPLTLDAAATAWSAVELAGAIALFLAARERFRTRSVRRMTRAVAAIGLGVSILAVAQAATAGRSIYWMFPTRFEGPLPFGPFVNRNHFATWAIMAIPLCAGYIAARAEVHRRSHPRPDRRAPTLDFNDDRTFWLGASITALTIALLLSLSRSAALGLSLSGTVTLFLSRRALAPAHVRGLFVSMALLLGFAVSLADLSAVRERIVGAPAAVASRVTIWRETVPVVRHFLSTGTGAGTYELAMRVYQRSDRRVFFNQAHNHYLQLAAEGGLLLVVPFLMAAVAFVRTAHRRLALDTTGLRWIRVGAACGLGAVAVQSVWETGLTMSANAALAAILAALVVHEREP
jgi:O-antigen ligase